jgi:hypothetical protein
MKDATGRLSGYGRHGDKRERRKRTRGAALADALKNAQEALAKSSVSDTLNQEGQTNDK